MIKITAHSVIHSISPVLQITETFQKRVLVLNDYWERDGNINDNLVAIDFTGERMALLDTVAPGQRVAVEAAVNGRESNGRYWVSLKGLTVTPIQAQPQQLYQQPPLQQSVQSPQSAQKLDKLPF